MSADTDIMKHERNSNFLRPRDESASVARMKPPSRQPKKKDEAGKPEIIEGEHWRLKSEMVEVGDGLSQAHAEVESWQTLEVEEH